MDWQDISGFAIVAFGLCCTWLAVYSTLRTFERNRNARLFLDSWLVWLTWFLPNLALRFYFVALFHFRDKLLFLGVSLVIITPAIALTLRLLNKPEKMPEILLSEITDDSIVARTKIWKIAFLVNIAAIAVSVALIAASIAAQLVMEKIDPRPSNQFGIYDN